MLVSCILSNVIKQLSDVGDSEGYYYVRVRAYVEDDYNSKIYGKWSSVKKIKIKK